MGGGGERRRAIDIADFVLIVCNNSTVRFTSISWDELRIAMQQAALTPDTMQNMQISSSSFQENPVIVSLA